jgi:hypothetical protein
LKTTKPHGHKEEGNIGTARYPRLPPGEYLFQVRACNEDGVWNSSGAKLAVTVLLSVLADLVVPDLDGCPL